jgi:hypothetical protein
MRFLRFLLIALAVALGRPALADAPAADRLAYRGFSIDLSAAKSAADFDQIKTSLKRQIDIVADCGAKPDVMAFLRAQPIAVVPNALETQGLYDRAHGVRIDAVPQPSGEPILLHELLHAFHAQRLPMGFENPAVLDFYLHAKRAGLYREDAFLLRNPAEYFAVTASLYLFGHVDRLPFTREILRGRQPYYYAWLGKLFGVQK